MASPRVRVHPAEDRAGAVVVSLADKDWLGVTVTLRGRERTFWVATAAELEAEAVAGVLEGGSGSLLRVTASVERVRSAFPGLLDVQHQRHWLGVALDDPLRSAGLRSGRAGLLALAMDPDRRVRLAVAANRFAPPHALQLLRTDADDEVRRAAAEERPFRAARPRGTTRPWWATEPRPPVDWPVRRREW